MTGHEEANSAIFPVHGGLRCAGGIARRGIIMIVQDIPDAKVSTAARLINQPIRVQSFNQPDKVGGIGLSHAVGAAGLALVLVKNIPHDDGGAIPMVCHQRAQFRDELQRIDRRRVGIARVGIAGRHILPDHQPQSVGPIIPALAFHFFVFANRVISQGFYFLEIEFQRVVCGRSINPIGPVALVQRPHAENGLVVEIDSWDARGDVCGNFSHPEIAGHSVICHASLDDRYLEVIEKWIVGSPEVGI